MSNTLVIEDWDRILENCVGGPESWKLSRRITIYNSVTHKKAVYDEDLVPKADVSGACERYNVLELQTRPSSCLILLDLDYKDKIDQSKNFATREAPLIDYLTKNPGIFYWERTVSNGLHIILCVDAKLITVPEPSEIRTTTGKICEFKKNIIVSPSKGYRSCCKTPLSRLSPTLARNYVQQVLQFYTNDEHNIGNYISITEKPLVSPSKARTAAAKRSLAAAKQNERDGFAEFMESQYVSTHNFVEDDSPDEIVVETIKPPVTTKKRTAPKDKSSEPATKRARGKPKNRKDVFGDICAQRLERHFDQEMAQNELKSDEDGGDEVQLSPVDALYLNLMEKIADNAEETCFGQSIARDITFALFKTLRSFIFFIKKQEDEREIELFPVNVQIFLEILLCSDQHMKRDVHCRFYHERITDENADPQLRKSFSPNFLSIFSRLGSWPHWRSWTEIFQRLFDKIQVTNPGTGHMQDGTFDAYSLYRSITRLNVEGAAKSESDARAEYESIFQESTRNEIYNARTKWSLFFEFILVTLGSIHLNSIVVTQFKEFVDFAEKRTGEMTIYCNIFQDIKLQGIRFEMNHIMEENDRGKSIPVAVINFFKYPWMKTNTPLFHTIVAKFFPNMNTVTIEQFIEHIGMRYRQLALGAKRIDFYHWSNCVPFENGIFDFEIFFKHLDEITRNEDALTKRTPHARFEIETGVVPAAAASDDGEHLFSINDFSRKHYELESKDISAAFSYNSILEYIKIVLVVRKHKHKAIQQIEKHLAELDSAELDAYLAKLCSIYRNRYNISIIPQDFVDYRYFSIFRHYMPTDTVFKPISKCFSPSEYLETFFTTSLLSLDNHTRYSPEFCAYIRSLFGADVSAGLMGPFQYSRLLVVMLVIVQGFLRTKLFQVALNLVGPGSNGKSFFMFMLKKCLGDKMANVQSKIMYGNTNETNQQAVGLEEAFFVYDQDADFVELSEFKKGVADIDGVLKRRLYHSLDRSLLDYTTPIFCSNTPLRYRRPPGVDDKTYEYAFNRRLVVVPYYNKVGKVEKNIVLNMYNILEMYQEKVATGEIDPNETPFEDFERIQLESENMNEKSLFVKEGFDLKNKSTLHNILLGLFWYLLDVLHVFGLASLSASSNDYVTASPASARLLGQANYYFVRLLLDHHYCLDQIETDIQVIAKARIDLYEFYIKAAPKSFKFEMMTSICETLRVCFGIHIVVNTPMTASNPQYPSTIDDGYSDVRGAGINETELTGVYFAYGLIKKSEATPQQIARFGRQHYARFTNATTRQVMASIPPGHRSGFGPITSKVHDTISALCQGMPVEPWTKPVLTNDWRHTTLAHLFSK